MEVHELIERKLREMRFAIDRIDSPESDVSHDDFR